MAAGGSRQLLEVDEKTLDATRPIPLEDVPDTMALSNEVDEAQVFFFLLSFNSYEPEGSLELPMGILDVRCSQCFLYDSTYHVSM